jgi:hypothetical protein
MRGQDSEGRHFHDHLRQYNSSLSFTSLKYTSDERLAQLPPGIKCFQIHGQLYHLQGPLEPGDNSAPKFAQLYLYDPAFAANSRHNLHPNLRPTILTQLTNILHEVNPYVVKYRTAKEQLDDIDVHEEEVWILLNPQLKLILEMGKDARRHNLPTSEEVAMIIPEEYEKSTSRDNVLAFRSAGENGNHYSLINSSHASYMPLHYVLLFPFGEPGWHWRLELQNQNGERSRTRLGQRTYYRYRLHIRSGTPQLLFFAKRLFQQYVVDIWAMCDQNKLSWL